MIQISLKAPAKLNLSLDIAGRLENGYHVMDMVMQAVGLYERVTVAKSRDFVLRCPGSRVPTDDRNTATKAAEAFFYETGLLAGCEITLHKTVPTRAGLAGGSADAAAVLMGLNELYGARLSLDELCAIGVKVGVDVPFSLLGGTARATGMGERLAPLPLLPDCLFVIAMPPGGGVSTPEAYRRYDEQGSPDHPDVAAAEAAIRAGSLSSLAPHMQNALEHSNAGPHTADIKAALLAGGATAAMMTGSGAAVFGLFAGPNKEQTARAAAGAIKPLAKQVFIAPPVAHGPVVENRL